MRTRRSGISSVVGSVFFILIVIFSVGGLILMFNNFSFFVDRIHGTVQAANQASLSRLDVQNVSFGGQFYSKSGSLIGAPNSAENPLLPLTNMNLTRSSHGWSISKAYTLVQDNATAQNVNSSSMSTGPTIFTLTVVNTNNPSRLLYEIAKISLLVDTNFVLAGVQPAPPFSWSRAITGNNITWTTPPANGYPRPLSCATAAAPCFQWSATLPSAVGTYFHTVLVSWVQNSVAPFVDTGIGTVNTTITIPATSSTSKAVITAAKPGTNPGGLVAGYDPFSTTATSGSGPGSLFISFKPTFNGVLLPRGQQLNASVGFTSDFRLDSATAGKLQSGAGSAVHALSWESSIDSVSSVNNPYILYRAMLLGPSGRVPIPIGGSNRNYVDPTLVNYFGPTGWVNNRTPFSVPNAYWTNGLYKLVITITISMPGAAPPETQYPPQILMHFDDIGLGLKPIYQAGLGLPKTWFGSQTFQFPTNLNISKVESMQLGVNVTGANNQNTTVYAYVADNSRFVFNPRLWVQFGSISFNNSARINAFFPLPNAGYYINSTKYLDVKINAWSAVNQFTTPLKVSVYAIIRTADQTQVIVTLASKSSQPIHAVAMYISGPSGIMSFDVNSAGFSKFDHWLGTADQLLVIDRYPWIPGQAYTVTVTTGAGQSFSRSFTAPTA